MQIKESMQIKAFKGVRVDVFEVSGVDESRAARCDFCVRRMGPGERGATLSHGGERAKAAITICRYCAARFNQIVQRVKP